MIRSRVLSVLAALGLALGLGILAPWSASAEPQLSPGCANLHSFEPSHLVSSSNVIALTEASYTAGEQIRLVATNDTGILPFVNILRPGKPDAHLVGALGSTILYTIPASGSYSFELTSAMPPTPMTWQPGCGLPPNPSMTFAPGDIYVGQHVEAQVACLEGTNSLATCVDKQGPLNPSCATTGCTRTLDTAIPGSYLYTVTGTDSRGLTRQTQFWYSVLPKKQQSISFSSTPPTNAIFDRINGLGGYVPSATSSSGLPITYTVESAGNVCFGMPGVIGEPGSVEAGRITIFWNEPGICTVHADQPGTGEYLPAQRVSQSFEVHREITHLTAARAVKGVLGLTPTTFRAELSQEFRMGPGIATGPLPDKQVGFFVAGKKVCTATTVLVKNPGDFFGTTVATCKATIGVQAALKEKSYVAAYAGDTYTDPSTAIGVLAP